MCLFLGSGKCIYLPSAQKRGGGIPATALSPGGSPGWGEGIGGLLSLSLAGGVSMVCFWERVGSCIKLVHRSQEVKINLENPIDNLLEDP